MATYAIGDIHGCLRTFQALLTRVNFNPARDTLWLTGDIVNRGPNSLEMLRWVHDHRHCLRLVLGNHDLALLAAHLGVHPPTAATQLILRADDGNKLCHWLRRQPLAIAESDYVMIHAGRLATWEQTQTLELAAEVATRIQTDDDFFNVMYGNNPTRWHPAFSADNRCRLIINALTRLRLLNNDGSLYLDYAGEPNQRPPGTVPWFDFPHRQWWQATVIFGHWSSLGLVMRSDIMAIDTGCLWGRQLTAVRLEDRTVFQVPTQEDDIPL
ncbi:symmetrical bis(5'-nucleosyl)-tetraphosphatase [Candidatus Persebacteraceae bacterium Df01]|jgi:bis(5'-nucleosyl)-tetraphosphatase (symmetrical)|uniref:bis(5'-nucleosyl)-tetraphosphatase (symmetrical) n=1 Tax=Candidatus Doriopsillibacter californiensis TaxID=2970740 RepID=A0ABT7QLU2_9GAMM|nr:symmetrical bis(5'-nucleosyl)-tetraphosphatase [Candidatus Persebacteraceae bacterium Df01]